MLNGEVIWQASDSPLSKELHDEIIHFPQHLVHQHFLNEIVLFDLLTYVIDSVTRLGDFLKYLAINLLTKLAQKDW